MKVTVLAFVMFGGFALAQDAPTIQKCRADAAMWEPQPYSESFFEALPMAELDRRQTTLLSCLMLSEEKLKHSMAAKYGDPIPSEETVHWTILESIYQAHEIGRLFKFIKHQGQWAQFNKEDAGGQR